MPTESPTENPTELDRTVNNPSSDESDLPSVMQWVLGALVSVVVLIAVVTGCVWCKGCVARKLQQRDSDASAADDPDEEVAVSDAERVPINESSDAN